MSQDSQSFDQLLTVEEVRRITRLSRSKVYQLVRHGVLAAVPGLGRCIRIRSSSLRTLVERGETRHA